jgi:Fe-Mn family superoxide dismutase
MSYELPDLPYAYDALEPYIDAKTMEIHHQKHHGGYVQKLNKALESQPKLQKHSLVDLLADLSSLPDSVRTAVRNNGGGHFNHTLFWKMMTKADAREAPAGQLERALESGFGSVGDFKRKFSEAALGHFGSGWAWLAVREGKLEIVTTPNQDSPVVDGYKPILGIDVWEHAYYLKYQNRRKDYVEAWWNVVNWKQVATNLERAR